MVSNHDGSIVYFDLGPVLYTTAEISKTTPSKTPRSKTEDAEASIPIAEWGLNNDFPVQARTAKESNPDLISALDWKARALYATGLDYILRDRYTLEDVHHLPENKAKVYEIDQFKFRNRHYLIQAAVDFYDLNNVFAQVILSEDRKKITRIAALEAADCRFKKRTEQGKLEEVWLHPDWEEWDNSEKDEKLTKLKIIDVLNFDPEEFKKDQGSTLKYVYPVSYPTGKRYYQMPHWWAVKISDWLDFTNIIPTAKKAIVRNMALIQYHIEMPDSWMPDRYKKWATMTDEEKKEATTKEFKIINDTLHKPENHGKSIYTTFKTAQGSQKEYGNWKITAIDNKMKDGALLADSSEGVMKIMSATGIDPSLTGLIPGKGGSNRSGSDKREALNIYMSLNQPHVDLILDPWQTTSWYNGYTDEQHECIWYIKLPHLQTLNKVTPSERETTKQDDVN